MLVIDDDCGRCALCHSQNSYHQLRATMYSCVIEFQYCVEGLAQYHNLNECISLSMYILTAK